MTFDGRKPWPAEHQRGRRAFAFCFRLERENLRDLSLAAGRGRRFDGIGLSLGDASCYFRPRKDRGVNVVETRQNEGGSEVLAAPVEASVNLEEVLDAWSTSASGKQRFERIRLERKDGRAFEALIDHETARDLGDKLTITAARVRIRSRGPSPIAEAASSPKAAGDEEDQARARKVLALLGLEPSEATSFFAVALVDEFRALREDREKAFAMIEEQSAYHAKADELSRKVVAEKIAELGDARGELESVKADRDRLIADAAAKDVVVE